MVGVVIEVLQLMLLALVALSLLSTLLSHAFAWYYFASYDRRFPRGEYAPPVSIIKPVKGVDQSALANFRGFCEQDYPSDYEVVFCVEGRDDPSVPVIERIIEEYPDRDVRLTFSDPEDARSVGKLKNMIAGYAHSSYEVIVFSDSDAQVPPNFLRETVRLPRGPGGGAWVRRAGVRGGTGLGGSADGLLGKPVRPTSRVDVPVPGVRRGRRYHDGDEEGSDRARWGVGAVRTPQHRRPPVGPGAARGRLPHPSAQAAGPRLPPALHLWAVVDADAPLAGDHPPLLAEQLSHHERDGPRPLVGPNLPTGLPTCR